MFLILVLALIISAVFIIFYGSRPSSTQRNKKSREGIEPNNGSDPSMLFFTPPQDIPDTLSNTSNYGSYVDTSVTNSPGTDVDSGVSFSSGDYGGSVDSSGGLGSALADAFDGGAGSFSAVDSNSDFGGSTDFGGGSTDGSSGV